MPHLIGKSLMFNWEILYARALYVQIYWGNAEAIRGNYLGNSRGQMQFYFTNFNFHFSRAGQYYLAIYFHLRGNLHGLLILLTN